MYTEDPCLSAASLQDLKYELLAAGSEDLEFHATKNSHGTRKRIAERICELENIKVHTYGSTSVTPTRRKQDAVDQLADRGHKTRAKNVMSSANADTYGLPEKVFERFLRFFSTCVS